MMTERLSYVLTLFSSLCLLILSFSAHAQPSFSQKEKDWIKQHPIVKVAIDNNWAPIEFIDHKGQLSGISKAYLNYLTDATGITFIADTSLSWNQAVEKMKSRELDMYSAVKNTPERRHYVSFTTPYLKTAMVIATQRGEQHILSMQQLAGRTISVVKGYATEELLRDNYPNIQLDLVDSTLEGLKQVSKGFSYGYIDNLAVVGYHINKAGLTDLQISGETPFNFNIAMAVRSDWPELHSIIQKSLDSIEPHIESKIQQQWLQVDYKKSFEWQQILPFIIMVLIIILVMLIYNRKLSLLNKKLLNSNQSLIDTQQALQISNDRLEKISHTDYLTNTYNRKHIDTVINEAIHRNDRYQTVFSLMLLDLDNFKQTNDHFGHLMGDEVLKTVAQTIKQQLRTSDTLARWGGEEFVIVCPSTSSEQAKVIADKVLTSLQNLKFAGDFTQTLSIGIAQHQIHEPLKSLIGRADHALYQAKTQGKNCAIINTQTPAL